MALHPNFPTSPYAPLIPEQRWFPADETMRATAYEKLLPPLVSKVRKEVFAWRNKSYAGASATSVALLKWWFETEHLTENADSSLTTFNYYFAQREAVETVIWLHEVKAARDKFDLMRFDSSEAVSAGMFAEDWPRYVLKMATGAGKTKVLSLLIAWNFFHKTYEEDSTLSRNGKRWKQSSGFMKSGRHETSLISCALMRRARFPPECLRKIGRATF